MTYLLIGNNCERKDLIINIVSQYFENNYNIDEIHYLLDLIINDTLRLDKELFEKNFYILCEKFKEDFINYYNDLEENEIDISPSNYILKENFIEGLKSFYNNLNSI